MADYGKDDFKGMVEDWMADHVGEMDSLEIYEIELVDGAWVAIAHDEKSTYSLTDDGTGNIAINYLGTR